MIDVPVSAMGHLLNTFGIKRGSVFKKQFLKKYGPDALNKFKEIIENPNATLVDAGKYFGFSREYARQVYRNLYGKSYTEVNKRKMIVRRNHRKENKGNHNIPEVSLKIILKLMTLGYNPEFMKKSSSYWISVNGYRILLRSGKHPVKNRKKLYFQINLDRHISKKEFDFCICLLMYGTNEIYYVIPSDICSKCCISLPMAKNVQNRKYGKYLDAWHLLKPVKILQEFNPKRKPGRINLRSRLINPNPISVEIRALLTNRTNIENSTKRCI